MPQPIIGITMSVDPGRTIRQGVDYAFIRREYGEEVRRAGGQPIFLEPSIDAQTAAALCDGVVISGGEDIDPALYGAAPSERLGVLEPRRRTDWERELIEACDGRGVPILGICYGNQLLNVHYGGTLYQDIASEHGSALDHGTSAKAALHKVAFSQDFLGYGAGESVLSAARHHQAVRDLAPGFQAVAQADDGVIEAIAGHGHFGIQWHPESDGTAGQVYGAFVATCQREESSPLARLVPVPEAL